MFALAFILFLPMRHKFDLPSLSWIIRSWTNPWYPTLPLSIPCVAS